jgi:GNAT superfamily N-acetyltransferase
VLAIAVQDGTVVGMASAFTYVHPDKDTAMFINEVGVIEDCQGQGIGAALVRFLCEHARALGCYEAWVATERDNSAARKAYARAGGQLAEDPIVMYSYDLDPQAADSRSEPG